MVEDVDFDEPQKELAQHHIGSRYRPAIL